MSASAWPVPEAAIERTVLADCRRIIATQSRSFALAARLLPAACRDEVFVIYAFCRHVDDAIDRAPAGERPAALARLRAEVDAVYAGRPLPHPRLAAFAAVVHARGIPRRYVDELLAGMAMDVAGVTYATTDDLLRYAHRVAGVVGLMLCHVWGLYDPHALPRAAQLGIAMQLTNICRDVAEDLRHGRLYLPRALLGRALTDVPADGSADRDAVRVAVATLLGAADRFYRAADEAMVALPARVAFAVRTAARLYAAIGDVLRARGGDPFRGRAVVGRARKTWLVVCAALATVAELPRRRARRAAPPDRVLDFADVVRHGSPA
jgi:phytoene synthase